MKKTGHETPPAAAKDPFWGLFATLLPLGCVLIFWRVGHFDFAGLDDDRNLVFNPHLGSLTFHRIGWAFTNWDYAGQYIPLGWLSRSVIFGFTGLTATGYHVAAVAMNALNSLLVFAVLARFADFALGADSSRWRAIAVFLAAAFWAWHPLRVESAAWASEMLYEQAALFVFLAIWLHLGSMDAAVENPADRAGKKKANASSSHPSGTPRMFSLGCYAVALLTHPAALAACPIFFLLDARRGGWRRALARNTGYLSVTAVMLFITIAARFSSITPGASVPSLAVFPFWQRLVQALYMWGHYLWRPLAPFSLSPVDPVLLDITDPTFQLVASLGLLGAVAFYVFVSRHGGAAKRWFFIAYLAVLVPFLGFWEKPHFPGDRHAFLAQLVMAAGVVLILAQRKSDQKIISYSAPIVLGVSILLIQDQAEIWKDEPTNWGHVDTKIGAGRSPVLVVRRALSQFRIGAGPGAITRIDFALRERPGNPSLLAAKEEIMTLEAENQQRAKALGLTTPPPYFTVQHMIVAAELGRNGDSAAAALHIKEAAKFAPQFVAGTFRAAMAMPPAK